MNATGRSALIICFSLLSAACGRKGALIYPDMLVPASPAAVSGRQSGSAVKLQFVLPDKDMSGRPVKGVAGAKISRMASEAGHKDLCRSCLADYLLLRTLNLDHLPTDTELIGTLLVMLDVDVKAGNSYSYRIIPFTADGIEGAPASISDVHVVPPISGPYFKIESLPTEIRLQFAVQSPLSGRFLGYNLYRSPVAGTRSFQPLNRLPLTGNEFMDSGVERGMKYRYAARILLELETGNIVESLESAEAVGMLKDDDE